MAIPQILEGTWEELAAQSDQFKGHNLRLIVLPHDMDVTEEAEQGRLHELLQTLFEEADSIKREPGKPLID